MGRHQRLHRRLRAVQLWTYSSGNNQQWLPVAEADGAYHFVNRNSGKCLDVPSASTADSVQLAQYTCNGTAAQSFTLGGGTTNPPGTPDFGPNVTVFDPAMSASSIQSKLDSVFSQQETNQFGSARQALLFKPGTYSANANVGFYAGRRPRVLAGRRDDQRFRARGGRLVPGQRHPELLA
ncbi:Ricin-type beta-trefoil lectin domain-like [Streptomyces sp. OV198]|nr:Ricin-type beta-trefoil lectin domain-like [Streptomyces sp. OV198]